MEKAHEKPIITADIYERRKDDRIVLLETNNKLYIMLSILFNFVVL